MGTITAQEIIDRAEIILVDVGNDRWEEADLLGWLNMGLRELVRFIPTALTVTEAVNLAAGVKQTIPTGRIEFIGATMNMGTDGSTPGAIINFMDFKELGFVKPSWPTETQAAITEIVTKKDGDRASYYVSPPSDGTGYIEIICSDTPTEIAIGQVIPVDDIYEAILMDYVLFRSFSIDQVHPVYKSLALDYFKKFTESVGAKISTEEASNTASRG